MASGDKELSTEQLEEHRARWATRLASCMRDGARSMLPYIDPANLLGVDTTRKGVNTAASDSVYGVTRKTKRQFLDAVVMVRVGEFYEAMGYDAVMLVEHAGLNPMGAMPFKAGTPVGNLHSTLKSLTDKGLSVAVVEEVKQAVVYGTRPPTKERVLGGVVTPASPQYVYDAVSSTFAGEYDAPPILGLFMDAAGFSVATVSTDLRSYCITSGLPEASVVAHLLAMPSAMLCTHTSLHRLPGMGTNATPLGGSKSHPGAALRNALALHEGFRQTFGGDSPVGSLLDCVRKLNGLTMDTEFTQSAARSPDGGPRPLVLSTALSLGVVYSGTTPDLVQSLLPEGSPRAVVHAMRGLLLSPPDERITDALALALRHLRTYEHQFPELTLIPAAQVARLINDSQCNAPMFRKLLTLCRGFATFDDTAASGSLRRIAEALLTPAALDSGVVMPFDTLVDKCARCVAAIDEVVAPEPSNSDSAGSVAGPDNARDLIGSKLKDVGVSDFQPWPAGDCPIPKSNALPLELFESNERGFRGLVKRGCVQQAMDNLAAAAHALNAAVRADLMPCVEKWGQSAAGDAGRQAKVQLTFDVDNNAVWLKVAAKPRDAVDKALGIPPLRHPKDRRGVVVDDVWSTDAVDAAMDCYRKAVAAAEAAVFQALRDLSRRLVQEQLLVGLVGVSAFSLWLRLARDHTEECGAIRGWTLPELVPTDQPWKVEGLTPPWLKRSGPDAAVANAFDCDGMFLLTGPNMAGKSTLMRAAGACALLANCGLYVPAAKGTQVPRFKAYHVRMASADSPLMGLSHWALDMEEAKQAVDAATSLGRAACVLLDELGTGTEVHHATAMAAALIKRLHDSCCRGMFATHLHGVLPLVRPLPRIQLKCMETEASGQGRRLPTWRLVDGSSTESLAFEVAEGQGMPESVISDSEAFLQLLAQGGETRGDGGGDDDAATHVPAAAATPQSLKLSDVGAVLKAQLAGVLPGEHDVQLFTVEAGFTAPPALSRVEVVYAFQHEGGWYVGQTGSLPNRIQEHRSTYVKQLAFTYIKVPDRSAALVVEANSQNALLARGVRLISDADSKHKPMRNLAAPL